MGRPLTGRMKVYVMSEGRNVPNDAKIAELRPRLTIDGTRSLIVTGRRATADDRSPIAIVGTGPMSDC